MSDARTVVVHALINLPLRDFVGEEDNIHPCFYRECQVHTFSIRFTWENLIDQGRPTISRCLRVNRTCRHSGDGTKQNE